MKTYKTKPDNLSSVVIAIQGANLTDAIERDWEKLLPYVKGNAAGAKVQSAALEVSPHRMSTIAGKPFAKLVVRSNGQRLAHRDDGKIYTTEFCFSVTAGQEADHIFDLGK